MDRVINIDDDRHRAIAWHYGAFPEMLKLREELIELQVEVNVSMKSVPTKPHENMWSEMADVINCIIHVAITMGKSRYSAVGNRPEAEQANKKNGG